MQLNLRLKSVYIITLLLCIGVIPSSISNLISNITIDDDISGTLISLSALIFITTSILNRKINIFKGYIITVCFM